MKGLSSHHGKSAGKGHQTGYRRKKNKSKQREENSKLQETLEASKKTELNPKEFSEVLVQKLLQTEGFYN